MTLRTSANSSRSPTTSLRDPVISSRNPLRSSIISSWNSLRSIAISARAAMTSVRGSSCFRFNSRISGGLTGGMVPSKEPIDRHLLQGLRRDVSHLADSWFVTLTLLDRQCGLQALRADAPRGAFSSAHAVPQRSRRSREGVRHCPFRRPQNLGPPVTQNYW